MTDEKEVRQRVAYDLDANLKTLKVSFGDSEQLLVQTGGEDLDAVRTQLVLEGLRTVLQKATLKVPEEEKLVAIEEAYNRLVTEGMKVFERKGPGGVRGPKKAEKLEALALMKGTTTAKIKELLEAKTPEERDAILNHPKVLAKLEKMQAADLEL